MKTKPGGIMGLRLFIFVTLISVLIVFGVSCGDSESSDSDDDGTPTAAWTADGTISSGEYARTGKYGDWEINWRTDDEYIYIGLKAETTGWVAVGIQPGDEMEDADIVLGFVEDGQTKVYDSFSVGEYGPHSPDTQLGGTDDILEFAGNEQDGYTTIEFKRAFDTGDSYDNPLSAGENKIIWSYGATDDFSDKHAERGYGELKL